MMRAVWKYIVVITISLIPVASLAAVNLATLTGTVVEACGLYVYEDKGDDRLGRLLAFASADTNEQTLKIDLGYGVQSLPLHAKKEKKPTKAGGHVHRIYKTNLIEVTLELVSNGPCGNDEDAMDSKSCKATGFTGTLTLKTSTGEHKYDVIVNDGC